MSDRTTEDFDHTAESFDEWFRRNEELCHEMLRSDQYELLYQAWFGGYSAGLDAMANMTSPLWLKPLNTNIPIDNSDDVV